MKQKTSQGDKDKEVLLPLTGDPIQLGHIDLAERASKVFKRVKFALADNPDKEGKLLFSLEERMGMARKSLSHLPNLDVVSFKGLTVDYAYEYMISDIVRGIRDKNDFESESEIKDVNDSQIPGIRHHFWKAKPELRHVKSSTAKAVQKAQGFTHGYVPLHVKQSLETRLSSQHIIGVTGEIAAGKSYIGDKLVEAGKKKGIPVYNIDLDSIGHDILERLTEPIYASVRKEIADTFGKHVQRKDGFIDRKALGEIVFNDSKKLKQLNKIMSRPLQVRLRRELWGKKGLILFNAALIAEGGITYLCNNNVVLVTADKQSQEKRIKKRNLTSEQIKRRLASQYNTEEKKAKILQEIAKHNHGTLWDFDNSDNSDPKNIEQLFDNIIMKIDIYGDLRFRGLWNRIGADGTPDAAYHDIRREHAKSHRYYHTLTHVMNMLNEFQNIKHLLKKPDPVEFAIWTHDYNYAEKSRVNEEKSAQFAYNLCKDAQVSEEFAKAVYDLNVITKHDNAPRTIDQAYIIDLDLLILGMDTKTFDEYEKKIRQEYDYVPEKEFRENRANILKKFTKKKHIYNTQYFRNKYEAQAKENLNRSINKLEV